jgi:succinate dehydrogenase / fumarate reductase membrane anchor subunit
MAAPGPAQTSMRSGLGRVRGLGSARDGVSHWWMQRLAAVALVPLSLWFVFSVAALRGASQADVQAWIASPFVTVLLLLVVVATFLHLAMGLQTVIEDYIRDGVAKVAALLVVKWACVLFGLASVLAILRIAI